MKYVIALTALFVVVSACSSGSDDAEAATASSTPTEASTTSAAAPTTPPALAAGAVAGGQVEIDGTVIDYVTSTPAGFQAGDAAPVLLAFPPGGQDLDLTRSIVENVYATEASRLGWVVVSPAAPDGTLYFQGSESLLPGFVDWVDTWVEAEGGAPHVAGVSNGGISSFRYAAQNPDRVRSIVVFPGFARSDHDRQALPDLAEVPIRLLVGENDTGWVDSANTTVAAIEAAGGDVELTVFPGEGHILSSTADGTLIFQQLESFRG